MNVDKTMRLIKYSGVTLIVVSMLVCQESAVCQTVEMGYVYDSEQTPPENGSLLFSAFIGERPEEIVYSDVNPGCYYQDGAWYVNLDEFSEWTESETLCISFYDTGSDESGYLEYVISSAGVSGAAQSQDTTPQCSSCPPPCYLWKADFGDSPDPPYRTSFRRFGPFHMYPQRIHLGENYSVERGARDPMDPDGQSNLDPFDTDGYDDGVVIHVVDGADVGSVDVEVCGYPGVGGYVSGWVDWDGDGDSYDAGERIISAERVFTGDGCESYSFTISVPPDPAEELWFRFRIGRRCWEVHHSTLGAFYGEVEDYHFVPVGPTAVELVFFKGRRLPHFGKTLLLWKTAAEIDNEGYNVYRLSPNGEGLVKINELMIPAQGRLDEGATYWLMDTSAERGNAYVLEDVDTSGVATQHGPFPIAP
jgi:hypothetical protein